MLHLIQHKRQKLSDRPTAHLLKMVASIFSFFGFPFIYQHQISQLIGGIFMDNDLKTHGVYVKQSLTIQAFKLKDLFQPLFLSSYWLAKGFVKVRKLGICWRLSYTKIKNKIKETKMHVPFFS